MVFYTRLGGTYGKKISIHTPIQTLVTTHPEIIDLMIEVGFTDILKPMLLQTVGRVMTLSKGSKMRSIPMETIREVFEKHHFILEDDK